MPNRNLLRAALPAALLASAISAAALRSQTPNGPTNTAASNAAPAPSDARADAKTKADGTARQTAHPWTGSPYGPSNSYEAADRARLLRIAQVMDDLKIGRGSSVADIGAGGGWFTLLAARRVGARGRVYAEDILPKYTTFIASRARREGFKNVRTILGSTTDPKLPRNVLDSVMILNAYHEFDQPLAMLRKISAGMKRGARLAFIERDDDELRQQAAQAIAETGQPKHRLDEKPDGNEFTDDHRLALPIVERESAAVGLAKVKSYELGEDNYVLIVEKK